MKDVTIVVLLQSIPNRIYHLFEDEGTLIRVEKGHHIFQEGERAEDIFLIQSGTIHIGKETESGKELTIRICGEGSVIGECALFCHTNYFATTAKAVEPTSIYVINKNTLELLLTEHPTLMVEYMKWLQTENLKHQSRLRDLVLHGKKGALFSTLIRLTNTYGKPLENGHVFIDCSLTNSDIASLCATSREMINRMLNDLKKNNILSFNKGYITIHNLNYLKNEIDCENCPLSICRID